MAEHDQQHMKKRTRLSAEERRDQILCAAGPHFAEHGYRCTDVQDIADAIGVGKGTIYRLFDSKEALFLACVERAVETIHSRATTAVEGLNDPLEKIRLATRVYLQFFDDHPEVIELFIQERAEFRDRGKPVYFVQWERDRPDWDVLLDQLKAQGRMRSIDSAEAGRVFSDAMYGTVIAHRLAGATDPLVARAERILDILLHGMLVPGSESDTA
ncbi:TetR/AcrR family transcriptional regulator [Aquisalimonas asiatica]|uniref:Transcriptional regulator, TetR family n=1 Tax=Aquisalimonas asiatica TaxID=406100 RepID=A0A1H8V732_9GAMM|nr:TetR/AcrR family transcriptional regulator [Aquisalimonas asiatica]SEP11074.1 transcriptional regulator, TetR family [Aquisalimonas asiatica]